MFYFFAIFNSRLGQKFSIYSIDTHKNPDPNKNYHIQCWSWPFLFWLFWQLTAYSYTPKPGSTSSMNLESIALLPSDSKMEIFSLSNVLNAACHSRWMHMRELSPWENLPVQKKLNVRIMTIILLSSHFTILPIITKMRTELFLFMIDSENKLELSTLHDDDYIRISIYYLSIFFLLFFIKSI